MVILIIKSENTFHFPKTATPVARRAVASVDTTSDKFVSMPPAGVSILILGGNEVVAK